MKEQYECSGLLDYFNNCLTKTEQKAFEHHLDTCLDCQEELAELRMLTKDLPFSAEAVQPNQGMKKRVLAAVFSEAEAREEAKQPEKNKTLTREKPVIQKSKRWMQPLLAASLLLSLGANAYFVLNNQPEVREPTAARVVEEVSLAATKGVNGSAQATMVQEENASSVIVQAEQLKKLSGTEAYQVWLIDEKGNKVRAGTFRPNEKGKGAVSHSVPELADGTWSMIAVTLEPTPESDQPLGDIVFAAEL